MRCGNCPGHIGWNYYQRIGWMPIDPGTGRRHACTNPLPGFNECPRCHGQAFVPAGPFAPLTGLPCSTCDGRGIVEEE